MLAIEARGLRKTYGGFFAGRGKKEALCGLDLEVPEGVAFGLIGLNGAGKTTFIKALLGVVRVNEGVIRVLGQDPEEVSARARIGYLPERLFLPHALTPIQFLGSVARLKGVPRAEEAVLRQIRRVGLSGEEGRKIGGFSKGMRQRLGLAAALLGEPSLLVLDEPTDGIDPLGRAEIRRILSEERARGATLFLNSHLLSETERVCDRIGILSEGRLLREGPLETLCGSEHRYRARFEKPYDESVFVSLVSLGFRPVPGQEGQFLLDAADVAALNRQLDLARQKGALLVSLGRDIRELEDVLAEALAEGKRS